MINQSFWKNKRVFVTGHTGFKGSWLSLWLQSLGASVQGYALNRPTEPALFDVAGLEKTLRSEQGDIRDFEHLSACLRAFKPEIVFHLAAQPLVRPSYVNPMETYTTNVIGTVSLFEAVRAVGGVKALVNVTSDKCYENKEWLWGYREDEPMGGFDPYSNSKGCVELVTASYQQSFFNEAAGCALASARAGNVIGGGDWAADRLIPDILRTFSQEQTLSVRHPQAIRPWQHVLEPLSGYMMLAEKLYTESLAYAQAWNFGPEDRDARPVHWIVEQMAERWGGDPAWVHDTSPQPHEAHYLKLDCSKAKTQLGWHPQWSLADALGRIVAWHKAWLKGADMYAYTLGQINDYMNTQAGERHE